MTLNTRNSLAALFALILFSCGRSGGDDYAPAPEPAAIPGDPIVILADPARDKPLRVNIRGVVKNAVAVRRDYPVKIKGDDEGREFYFSLGVTPGAAGQPVDFSVLSGSTVLRSEFIDPESPEGWRDFHFTVPPGVREFEVRSGLKGQGAYLGHPRLVSARDARPWTAFILIDALRADALGVFGADPSPSPFIDALARRGAVFSQAHTASPFTLTSVASIFTGLYPWQHKVLFTGGGGLALSGKARSLIQDFRDAGYHTAAFSGTYFFFSRNGFAQGFDSMDETCAAAFFRGSADCLNERLERFIFEHAGEPVFLYVHYVDPHAPYYAPEEFRAPRIAGLPKPFFSDSAGGDVEQFGDNARWWQAWRRPSETELKWLRAGYDGEVAYADSRVSDLFSRMSSAMTSRPEPTVLLTADHGEAFYEHGAMDHVMDIHEPVMRVPLILAGTGIKPGTVVKQVVRTIDLLPSLLQLAGIEPITEITGQSFVNLMNGEKEKNPRHAAAIHYLDYRPEYALILWPWKLLWRPLDMDSGIPGLYNLEEDPGEINDLSGEKDQLAGAMISVLDELLKLPTPVGEGEARPYDADTRKRLEDLVYIVPR